MPPSSEFYLYGAQQLLRNRPHFVVIRCGAQILELRRIANAWRKAYQISDCRYPRDSLII